MRRPATIAACAALSAGLAACAPSRLCASPGREGDRDDASAYLVGITASYWLVNRLVA